MRGPAAAFASAIPSPNGPWTNRIVPRRRARLLTLVCALSVAAAPVRAAETCVRRPLVDAASGAPVRGVEDLAVDRTGGRVYLSAYDRWAVADAVDDGETPPRGGIYAVSLDALVERGGPVRVRELTGRLDGAFHPHGIGFVRQDGKARLFAVNHAWGKADGGWRKRFRLAVLEPRTPDLKERTRAWWCDSRVSPPPHNLPLPFAEGEGETAARGAARAGRGGGDPACAQRLGLTRVTSLRDPALCRANDVAAPTPTTAYVTRDHGACRGLGRWLEMGLGLDRAALLRVDLGEPPRLETIADGLAMANGVALSPDGERLAVAETRGERVRIYATDDPGAGPVATYALPGGPDNLTWSDSGDILAAVHESLLATGMARYRVFGRERAGSRVVVLDAATGETRTRVRDPEGTRLNMATAAVRVDGALVAAGLLDDALLVCRENDGQP